MTEQQEAGKELPEDAVIQVGFPPLNLPKLTDFPVVVTDILGLEEIWFNYYYSDCHGALQSLMRSLNQFYNSEAGDLYKVQNIREMKEGSVMAARYRKGEFHRVVLKAILPHSKFVRLEYVDYGSVSIQSVAECRYLTPQFVNLPGQAVQARLWGITPVPDAKTEQGQTLREKLIDLLYNDCTHGSLLAVVKDVDYQHELDDDKKARMKKTTRRIMALEFYDAISFGGLNIGQALVDLGLAKPETGKKSYLDDGGHFIKSRKERDQSDVIKVPSKVQKIVRKDTDRVCPSGHLQLLRLHEAALSSWLDQMKMEAAGIREKNSARYQEEEIKEIISHYQDKLEEVKERRRKKVEEEQIE